MILLHEGWNFDLFKRISLAYSAAANRDADQLLLKANAHGHLIPLEPIPAADGNLRLGLIIGDATRHPLIDLYFGAIMGLLDFRHVEVVLLLSGDVDVSYEPVDTIINKARLQGTVVSLGEVTPENLVEVLFTVRMQRLHGCIDLIGSAAGEIRPIMTAGVALMQTHHLNFPNPQYPVDGKGNMHMITDPVLFAPHSEQTRIGGHEGMVKISCWMPPLMPNVMDESLSRESFGLDPNKLYLVFVALNSKLDPVSAGLYVGALERTGSDVLMWILSYPELGAINFIDCMKRHKSWKPEFELRVFRGQHLPKPLHLARLAAFGTGGRGAIFLNFGLTYPAHTTLQEALCAGILAMLFLLQAAAACAQLAAASLMDCVGLGDFVARDPDHALTLVDFWSHQDQDGLRETMSRVLRREYLAQEGFWNQKRMPAELVNAFKQIAANSRLNGGKISPQHVDARLPKEFPLPTNRFPDSSDDRTAWKPLIPLDPSSELELLMEQVRNFGQFESEQLPMVYDVFCCALRNKILPTEIIGSGGFCVAWKCATERKIGHQVLKIEYHRVFVTGKDDNTYNSEIIRGVYGEAHFKMRCGRIRAVRIAETPETVGDFAHAIGLTKPRGPQCEVLVFNFRTLLSNQWADLMETEFGKFRVSGELSDKVRLIQQVVQNSLGHLNENGKISFMDVSPRNLFFDGDVRHGAGVDVDDICENHHNTIVVADLGGAAVHDTGKTSSFPQPISRRHSTAVDPMRHQRGPVGKAQPRKSGGGPKSKAPAASKRAKAVLAKSQLDHMASQEWISPPNLGFTFWSADNVMKKVQKRAEKGGGLKQLRAGTRPYKDTSVSGLSLTAQLGEHIDRFATVRVLLHYLAPVMKGESIHAWDQEARKAAVSTVAMGKFIADRMPQALRDGHPRQPLMWDRLLAYLVIGLAEWPAARDAGVTLLGLTTSLFLSTPFLDPMDDRELASGGCISAPGGPLYGKVHSKLKGKTIKPVEVSHVPGKGVGVIACVDLVEGDVAAIYVCSCVPRNDPGIDSRYAISFLGGEPAKSEPLIYVARFTPKMSVRWHIQKKKSTGPFINAPGDGQRANCKLDRTMAWDDDEDMDLGRSLKIFPVLVDACGIKKGEELAWPYDPNAGNGDSFPIN